jgi:predicted nucleic acid-binding protein
VKYLLDVNALIAWQHPAAEDHEVFHAWAARETFQAFATCAQVELGFLRVSMQAFGYSAAVAQEALAEIKRSTGGFICEAPSPVLPAWCRRPGQTSDAYLAQVAAAAGLTLATFDAGIPGATLIR